MDINEVGICFVLMNLISSPHSLTHDTPTWLEIEFLRHSTTDDCIGRPCIPNGCIRLLYWFRRSSGRIMRLANIDLIGKLTSNAIGFCREAISRILLKSHRGKPS